MTKQLTFDSFPFLLEHLDPSTDRITLLPAGHARASLVAALDATFDADGLPCTLVLGPGDAVRLSADGAIPVPFPARPERLLVGTEDSPLDFTETAELFNRYRYLRAWHSFDYGTPLSADGESSHIGFHPGSGAARSLKEISTGNEVTEFLSHLGRQGVPFTDPEVRAFLRQASWYDRLAQLWDSGLRNEWLVWLAQQACAASLVPARVAGEVSSIVATGGRHAAARLLERFPDLFGARG